MAYDWKQADKEASKKTKKEAKPTQLKCPACGAVLAVEPQGDANAEHAAEKAEESEAED